MATGADGRGLSTGQHERGEQPYDEVGGIRGLDLVLVRAKQLPQRIAAPPLPHVYLWPCNVETSLIK